MAKGAKRRAMEVGAFVGAYAELCKSHGMMVIQLHEDGYQRFAVARLHEERQVLDQACEEMRIGRVLDLTGEEG